MIVMLIVVMTFPILLSSCQFDILGKEEEYRITNVKIFKDTPVWELALAVKNEKTRTIEKLAKENPELLNYQEPKYGATLLLWAVGMEKYKSAEALLKCGADPNIASTVDGMTPLYLAAGFSWIDNYAKKDPKFVKLLLKYNADPNITYGGNAIIEPGTSPLMNSIRCGIEKTKALVEAGAYINYKTKSGTTAAIKALLAGQNATLEALEYAHYLIVEKKAKVTDPYYPWLVYEENNIQELYPVDILRRWVYPLDSEEYRIKMEIVEEFARQGVNYWDTEIDKYTLEQIKSFILILGRNI